MGLRNGLTLSVDAITPERSIVLRATSPNLPRAVWSFHLQPHWDDRSRLTARARVGLRHPGEVFAMELARPAIALITRSVLLGIKRRVRRGHALSRRTPSPRQNLLRSVLDLEHALAQAFGGRFH